MDDVFSSGAAPQDTISVGGEPAPPSKPISTASTTASLVNNSQLTIDISDATSDKDKVYFTVHTKTTLTSFDKQEYKVKRMHEEFVWLHDQLANFGKYDGYIIPPAPPRPDFDSSRSKLQKLGSSEGAITSEDLAKMKEDLELEYLAMFKKTVAMHEVFLQRLAKHPKMCTDVDFKVFLEFDGELNVRTKSTKEKAQGILKSMTKTADENLILSNVRDESQFFQNEKCHLVQYHTRVKEAANSAETVNRHRVLKTQSLLRVQMAFNEMATSPVSMTQKSQAGTKEFEYTVELLKSFADFTESARKVENVIAADEDLKLVDTLKYYTRDSYAAKDVLYTRSRLLADYDTAKKNLDKARAKQRDIRYAEECQQSAYDKFTDISGIAETELTDFKNERVAYIRKNLESLADLQVKHSKDYCQLIKQVLDKVTEFTYETSLPPAVSS